MVVGMEGSARSFGKKRTEAEVIEKNTLTQPKDSKDSNVSLGTSQIEWVVGFRRPPPLFCKSRWSLDVFGSFPINLFVSPT